MRWDDVARLIDGCGPGHLATASPTGQPHVSIVFAARDGSTLWIAARTKSGKVAIVIRNQPHGSVAIKQVIPLPRMLTAVQPNGTVVSALDPNQTYLASLDARFVLEGQGRKSGGGVVFGNQNLKIGTPVEIEGNNYRITGTVTDLQINPR